jgi:uncharacterized membrane protein YgcG
MLAPIALYPDELLVQVLMAATYPLEVTQAARWVKANPNLRGDQLANALEQQNWDPSVKSLANFPSVLQMMDGKLDWTQKLGDAFLGQKDQVMDTVQNLRNKAYTQGNLKTTSEQKVIVQEKTIVIQPSNPEVVYVPAYNPTVVYGSWWYPSYPPYSYYPYGYTPGAAAFSFVSGVAVAAAWGYAWGGFNWGRRDVEINVYRNNRYNNRINRNYYENRYGGRDQVRWQHDRDHRRGVAYRDNNTRQQYGQARQGADNRRDYRGHPQDARDRTAASRDMATRERPDMKQTRDVPQRERTATAQSRDMPQHDRNAMQQPRSANAFTGFDRGAKEAKMASDRGSASRQSMSRPAAPRGGGGGGVNRPSGGGGGGRAHGGGGGGGGGKRSK